MTIELVVQGFQSVRNPVYLTLEGLTVIEGESNLGKSALVRAVLAAFSNKAGAYYITTGAESAVLEWRDGINNLVWEKRGSSVSYLVNGKKLHKPGRGVVVPPDVSQVGVSEIRTSDKRRFWPQIQCQGEPPFMVSECSPATAAELLNSNKDLITVSRALRLVRGDITQSATKLQVIEKQCKLISERTRLLETAHASSAQVYQDLEASFTVQAASQQNQDRLVGLADRWGFNQQQEAIFTQVQEVTLPAPPDVQQVQNLSTLLVRYMKLQGVLKASENLVPLGLSGDQITDRFRKLWSLYQRSSILARKLNCLKTVTAIGPVSKPDVQKTYQRYQDLKRLQERHLSLVGVKAAIDNGLIDISKKLKALDQESKQLNSMVQDLEACPFCEAPLHDGKFCPSVTTLRFP